MYLLFSIYKLGPLVSTMKSDMPISLLKKKLLQPKYTQTSLRHALIYNDIRYACSTPLPQPMYPLLQSTATVLKI
jgi:hypothetical protein